MIHFRQTAALFRACRDGLARPDSLRRLHPPCAGIIEASRAIDPRKAPSAALQARLSGLRAGIVERFQAEFTPDSLFARPDWARHLRILGYVDTADFLGWSRKNGYLEDSVALPLAKAKARLGGDTLAPARRLLAAPLPEPGKDAAPWTPEARMAFCFRLLAPDLERQLALDAYAREAEAAGPCLRDPGCAELEAEFELQHLAAGADADSLRVRLDIRWISPFIHKLRICLADAIWFDEGSNPSAFAYPGYLFNGAHHLGPADSAMVAAAIEAFGRDNAGLRQRVDEPGWDRAKADDLAAEKSPRAGAAALLEGLAPAGYGYIQLLLGPMMELRYAGTVASLKKSLDPRWRT